MKRILLIISVIAISLIHASAQNVQNVDAAQFQKLIGSGDGLILDVRTPGEYSRGHIDGSTLISVADPAFVSKVNLLQKDKPVFVYCLSGSRSIAAANYLAKNGFSKVYNLQYGLMDWSRRGYPIKQSQDVVASESTRFTEQTFTQLIRSKSVVLVDFQAPWCAPCKKMNPVIDRLAKDYQGKVKVEKVDVESNKVIADAYQVQSIPGFVLFKDGKKVWSYKGVISYEQLTEQIKKYL